ncbi:MAG: hypothetical protein HKL88_08420 [Bacteroidia bacterium]|nr:hypothetical protein [Bacteroidia bacterium]
MNLPPHLQKKVDEAAKEAEERMEIEYDLRNNPLYKNFFSRYNPADVEEFIKDYASRKVSWMSWGRNFYQQKEDQQLRNLFLAENCLWQIQQKKLFNLQCQWRAEKIKLRGISSTADFRYWEYHIKRCSFLPPITQWEFELFMDFMLSGENEIDPWENDGMFEWQDYGKFVKEAKLSDNRNDLVLPLWYAYFDNRMGTGSLMLLPDLRGEKEEKYIRLYNENRNKTAGEKEASGSNPLKRDDYLSAWEPKQVEEFISLFEDKLILKYYHFYHDKSNKPMDAADELAQEAFDELREVDEPVSIRAGSDWRESLIDAWEEYRNKQIVKLLPLVYDEYLHKQNLGISYQKEENPALAAQVREWKAIIIKGREIAGEASDMDF